MGSNTQGTSGSKFAGLLIGLLIVVVVIAAGCISHQKRVELVETFTATADDGVVERVEERRVRRNKRRITEYTYYVSFSDDDGIRHEGESLARTEKVRRHDEGDHVSVRYDPMKIDEACIIAGDEDEI